MAWAALGMKNSSRSAEKVSGLWAPSQASAERAFSMAEKSGQRMAR